MLHANYEFRNLMIPLSICLMNQYNLDIKIKNWPLKAKLEKAYHRFSFNYCLYDLKLLPFNIKNMPMCVPGFSGPRIPFSCWVRTARDLKQHGYSIPGVILFNVQTAYLTPKLFFSSFGGFMATKCFRESIFMSKWRYSNSGCKLFLCIRKIRFWSFQKFWGQI